MDVFALAASVGRQFLLDAAVWAAHEIGLFAALGDAPRPDGELAAALGVGRHRLRALLDVLRLAGAARHAAPGYLRAAVPPRPPAPPPHGWGRLAEVLRRDRPISDEPADPRAFHAHLTAAGDDPARELAARLPAGSLLDLGGGAGVYARAYLDRHPGSRAVLVDRPDVVPLAAEALGGRARLIAGDLLDPTLELGSGHDVVLLANVLHLYSPADCRALAARAAAAGDRVIVKELRIEADRSGPPTSVLFALNMAIYTEGGTVYDSDELAGYLRDAGLADLTHFALADDSIVLTGRRATSGQAPSRA